MNESPDNDPAATFLARFEPSTLRPELLQRLLAARPAAAPTPTPAPGKPKLKIISLFPRIAAAAAVFAATAATIHFLLPRENGTPAETTAHEQSPAKSSDGMTPVLLQSPQQSNQQLLGVRDIGIARDAQRRPVRLMHATWLDDNIYTGKDGSQSVREASVREEILPVVLTTY